MTGCTMRSSTPPPELISSMASNVAFNWDCSTADVTPVWENSTPTRHGASVFSLKLITLTWTISSCDGSDLTSHYRKLKSPCQRRRVPLAILGRGAADSRKLIYERYLHFCC